jgi:hypothetical protein
MLTSKKHAKSPPEKAIKKLTNHSHPVTIETLVDSDDESTSTVTNQSNITLPNAVDSTNRCIKITFHTKVGDNMYLMKHVHLLKKMLGFQGQVQAIYNKHHEVL